MLLRFRVGYFSKGSLVNNTSLIRRSYLRGLFVLDLLTILPLDFLAFGVKTYTDSHETLALLRLNRILRVHRLVSYFGSRENELRSNTTLIRAIKYTAIGTITIHLMACVWYSLACHNFGSGISACDEQSWAIKLSTGVETVSVGKRYILSLYWATATATGTGYGDIHAVTLGEKWFSIFSMLVGIGLFFGLILGRMTSMLTNLDSGRARYIHHLRVIKDHMTDINISSDVCSRVIAYYEYLWTHNRGVSGVGIFDDLPLSFQAELSLIINRNVLEKAPLFRGLNPGLKRMLSLVIHPVHFMPNQIIANKGDIGHHLFYIHRGRAEILCENNDEVLVTLTEGQLFGEVSMVHSLPRSASVRAATPCVVFLLDRGDLKKVLRHYPTVAQQFYLDVERRCDINQMHFKGNSPEDKGRGLIVDMENEEATKWLREIVGIKNDETKDTSENLFLRLTNYVIMPDSWLAVIWEKVVIAVVFIICFMYPFVSTFSISLHALGYGQSVVMNVLLGFSYLLDAVLVADFVMRFNMASVMTIDLHSIRESYKWSFLFWIDLFAILPIEIFAVTQTNLHDKWHSFSFLRLNRLLKAIRIPRFFSNLENSLHFDIAKVRALKFTLYILLVTHISGCIWFLDNCHGET
ncbi:cyclic nucleotide-gated channel rod photoreceptor subunit alpha-like [Montipora foliosa]|uniref:cyclic nucleotide-gated channel rod photoreceptor subunit alpha-like n=1 Tax=Montipora foliosa TaxID=591990 RepID=UPI0035F1E0CD